LAVGTLALVVALGAATGSLARGPATALREAVGAGVGHPVRGLLTSGLWAADGASYLAVAAAVLLLLAPAERRLGTRRALLGLIAGQVLGTAVGIAVIGALASTGDSWAREIARTDVLGPFPGLLAVAGLA